MIVEYELSEPLSLNNSWIIGNIKHAGFYRVNYDTTNWKSLISQLKDNHSKIDSISRAQLIDDLFNIGKAEIGQTTQILFLELIEYLKKEDDPLVFIAAFYSLDYISEMLVTNDAVFEDFKVFLYSLFVAIFLKNGNHNLIKIKLVIRVKNYDLTF